MRRPARFALILVLTCLASVVHAQTQAPSRAAARASRFPLRLPAGPASRDPAPLPAEPGSELTISLITMGQGSEVWELFGHNAIWIHDARAGTDVAYNWGVFDWRQEHFITRFLKGRMLYAMAGFTIDETLRSYEYLNRTVWSQELNLTPAQRAEIKAYIEWNQRPENVNYLYDYFRDNCSTRVRDILDRALGGQIRAAATKARTGTSYRWHTLRLMQGDKPLVTGVEIGLARPADRELSAWEEMFLPVKLHDFMRTLQVSDGRSGGATQPLVKNERVLFQASRPPEAPAPPRLGLPLLVVGLAIAGFFVWSGVRAAPGRRQARLVAVVALGIYSLIAGLLGVILTLLWTVTNHVFAYENENLLLFNPLWLVLVVLLPVYFARGLAARATRLVALTIATLAIMPLLLHVTTLSSQANWPVIALALPPALAVAWVVTRHAAFVRA